MTGAFLRAKTETGYKPVEVEHLPPEERRRHLKDRDPEEVMRWMDILCENLVECETLLTELEKEGLLVRKEQSHSIPGAEELTVTNDAMWWGYLHQNGSIQVKRWFGDRKDFTEDCEENDLIQQVVPPFTADSREEAIEILKQRLGS